MATTVSYLGDINIFLIFFSFLLLYLLHFETSVSFSSDPLKSIKNENIDQYSSKIRNIYTNLLIKIGQSETGARDSQVCPISAACLERIYYRGIPRGEIGLLVSLQ